MTWEWGEDQSSLYKTARTHLFELIFALLQVEMFPDDGVLSCELHDLLAVEVIQEARVDLPRELHGSQSLVNAVRKSGPAGLRT